MKNARIYSINNHLINENSNIKKIIQDTSDEEIILQIIPPEPTNIHPDTGLPQLNFDQFLHVATIHQYVLEGVTSIILHKEIDDFSNVVINKLTKNAFTRAQLIKSTNWSDWEKSEFLQLEQYK